MIIDRQLFESLIFKRHQPVQRFTQDSPIYPTVWLEFFDHRKELDTYRADLILTPHKKSSAAELFQTLIDRREFPLKRPRLQYKDWQIATNGETVVVKMTLKELVRYIMPLTQWWQHHQVIREGQPGEPYRWFRQLVGAIYYTGDDAPASNETERVKEWLVELDHVYQKHFSSVRPLKQSLPESIWSVNLNRQATLSIEKSVPATKADAGRRLFDIDGSGISWAIMDSGIDARHPAFRKADSNGQLFPDALGESQDPFSNHTRITATYDFTNFREIITKVFLWPEISNPTDDIVKSSSDKDDRKLPDKKIDRHLQQISYNLAHGMQLDWSVLAPLLRVAHNKQDYKAPKHPHGTHVAGILGANRVTENKFESLIGMCPGINIYDIRVMNEKGQAEEFNILAAIHFVRWLNSQKDRLVIHGVNMSFSIIHEVGTQYNNFILLR
jgi:subtilisin family serine protease